jgi:hypothetical protein
MDSAEIKVNGDEFFQKEVKIIKPRDGHHGERLRMRARMS